MRGPCGQRELTVQDDAVGGDDVSIGQCQAVLSIFKFIEFNVEALTLRPCGLWARTESKKVFSSPPVSSSRGCDEETQGEREAASASGLCLSRKIK